MTWILSRRAQAPDVAEANAKRPLVVIAGLGPGSPKHITREVKKQIDSVSEVYARIAKHPALEAFPKDVKVNTFDHLYEKEDSFEEVYSMIADKVVRLALKKGKVVYLVPGDPRVGEKTTQLILDRGNSSGVDVQVLPGVSFIESTLAALRIDALPGTILADAYELVDLHHLPFEPNTPLLISQIPNRAMAGDLKQVLLTAYRPEHRVALVHGAGSAQEVVEWMPLHKFDRSKRIDQLTSLYVPANDDSTFASLRDAMSEYRDGLELWDEVSHKQLAPALKRAAQKVMAATITGDDNKLAEGLAEVLAHTVAHLQLGEDDSSFRVADILSRAEEIVGTLLGDKGDSKTTDPAES